jgi:hypothetical protein
MSLESRAIHWLLYGNRFWLACRERVPRYGLGQPDVIGVRNNRNFTEIEIKRSVSDFRANAKKCHVINRDLNLHRWPRQFYYCVPSNLIDKITPMLPDWAGLLSDSELWLKVEKEAPINKASQRVSVKECIKLARCMANYCAACERKIDTLTQRFKDGQWQDEAEYLI